MSFKTMTWAASQKTGSPTKKLILLLLADRADEKGHCFPSLNRIASDCELCRSTVAKNIKQLADDGFLKINRRMKDGVSLSNTYTLLVGVVRQIPHPPPAGQGVVQQTDGGSPADGRGVVQQMDPNQSVESVNEPICPASRDGAVEDLNTSRSDENKTPPKPPSKSKRFVRPSVKDVEAYMIERNADKCINVASIASQAEKFYNRQESVGWMVGKSPMRNWKAAVRTWISNNYDGVFTNGDPKKRMQI